LLQLLHVHLLAGDMFAVCVEVRLPQPYCAGLFWLQTCNWLHVRQLKQLVVPHS
jgi:hypothetical protein